MQTKKENIEELILISARELFIQKGYSGTSMRGIALQSGVGLSNIYNYFQNKDMIFERVLIPLISKLEEMISGHKSDDLQPEKWFSKARYEHQFNDFCDLIENYNELLKLLLFKSHGSSLANYREVFTNKMTDTVLTSFSSIHENTGKPPLNISSFFIHLNISWMFTTIEELVMHKLNKEKLRQVVNEYITYETAGWKELIEK